MKTRIGSNLIVVLVAFTTLAGCTCDGTITTPTQQQAVSSPTPGTPAPIPITSLEIVSNAFGIGETIPERYTCFGDNVSPDLQWTGVPDGTESLLLFVYDLDAGADSGASVPPGFVHWVVYNIPADVTGYTEGVPAGATLVDGALQGSNDFAPYEEEGALFPGGAEVKRIGYDGPCPGAEHRYIFAVYALDTALDVDPGAPMTEIFEAMGGHTIAQAEYMGVYAPPQ